MIYTVTCPECGNRSLWEPQRRSPDTPVPFDEVDPVAGRGIRVRCLGRPLGTTRQMRREAERSGTPLVCGAEFIVRPLPPDDESAVDTGHDLPDPDTPVTADELRIPRQMLPMLLAATALAQPSGGRR